MTDRTSDYNIDDVNVLQAVLQTNMPDDSNSFWLSVERDTYPVLSILFKGELAYLNYIPNDGDAGFVGFAGDGSPFRGQQISFSMSAYSADDVVVCGETVFPRSKAIHVAVEFFNNHEMPSSISWQKI